MQKIYTWMLVISLIGLQESAMFAKNVKTTPDGTCVVVNKTVTQPLQAFIAKNGNLGIYQEKSGKAYIDENTYKKVSKVLITDSGKILEKPFRKTYLGVLIKGDKKYALYGRESYPEPINEGPDSDVQTEEKIQESFDNNFGIGLQEPSLVTKKLRTQPNPTYVVVNKTVRTQPVIAKQQEFIAENGNIGIYQAKSGKAYIDENTYKKINKVLMRDSGKVLKKPFRKAYLGMLVEGDKRYALYGRESDPEPIDDGPDSDVRTEEKIQEDFGSNFGSGKWTPNDKWD